MALEPVHVMEMDRSTSRLELTHINPTREFLEASATGMARYAWQNGKWYDTGGNPMDADAVPAWCQEQIKNIPVAITTAGPSVTRVCKLCGEEKNDSTMEQHLLEHVERTMRLAGSVENVTDVIPPPVRE